jgi:hypothetical protein
VGAAEGLVIFTWLGTGRPGVVDQVVAIVDQQVAGQVAEVAQTMVQPFPLNAYPNLMAFITEHALQPGYDYGDEFEYGLDLVLDGLEQAVSGPALRYGPTRGVPASAGRFGERPAPRSAQLPGTYISSSWPSSRRVR